MGVGEQRRLLSERYATTPNIELSKILGISVSMVQKHARFLGLKKDPKYLSETNRRCGMLSSRYRNRANHGN